MKLCLEEIHCAEKVDVNAPVISQKTLSGRRAKECCLIRFFFNRRQCTAYRDTSLRGGRDFTRNLIFPLASGLDGILDTGEASGA